MSENEFLSMLFDFLRGGGLVSVLAAAILLKKYVINGTVHRFFDLKEKEFAALGELRKDLGIVIQLHQWELEEVFLVPALREGGHFALM